MNVYSGLSHSTLKYLMDTEMNISNLLVMTGDFNIRDSIWDPSFPHHSSISDNLMIITDSFNLELSIPTNQVLTRYLDMVGEANSVIDLMFLQSGSNELNNHSIHPGWQLSSDHAPITVSIPITEENIVTSKFFIVKIAKRKRTSSKMYRPSSRASKSLIYQTLINSKMLPTLSHQILKIYGGQIQNKSTSLGTLRASGTMNVT